MTDRGLPRPVGKYALLRSLDEANASEHASRATRDTIATLKPGEPERATEKEAAPATPELYLAAEAAVDKPRAVLVLPATASGRADLAGARQLCGLVHPNLLQVLDAGRTDEEVFIASEWLAGCDLETLTARAAERKVEIPIATALYIIREVARGLHAAHTFSEKLAAHGGVAPCNILCGEGGEVKLTHRDRLELLLGGPHPVASTSTLASAAQRPRLLLPSARVRPYQAADQAWGAPPTRQGDIYALGAVLWELLTGHRLHDDEPVLSGLDHETATTQPGPQPGVPPSALAPRVPPAVDALVLRALDPRPEERFATAEELRQSLSRELARLAPDPGELVEPSGDCVAALLRAVLGDVLEQQRGEQQWLFDSARALLSRPRVHSGKGLPSPQSLAAAPAPLPAALRSGAVPVELAKTQLGPPRSSAQSPEERLEREQLIDGRYRLRRLIGVGGMGAVYEAEHTAICKRVALKILHPQFSRHADLVERLRREAQAASRIGHPNIVNVTDFGRTDDGSAYLAMEYLHGTDLGAILRARGRLPEARALHIGIQLVRALAAAHRALIIHRDLKPENVFLVDPIDWTEAEGARPELDGVPLLGQDLVKVLDFGIAMQQAESVPRPLPRAARLTSPGLTVGTPEYMAPEQAMGHKVDPRADIYAVGTMLYEMLCARVPFIAASVPELLTFKTSQDAPPPHLWLPAIGPAFEAVILRCLARDPAARPQSMEELERELSIVAVEHGVVLDSTLSGTFNIRAYLGGERPASGSPAPSGQRPVPPPPPPSRASIGRPAAAASSDSDGRLPPVGRVAEHGGSADTQLTATPAGSSVTVPPTWTARWQRTVTLSVLAVGMVVIGFTTARYVPRRPRPAPPPHQPLLPVTALEAVPVVALRPASQPASSAVSGDAREGPSEPPTARLTAPGPGPVPAHDQTAMLIEWARRAAAGGRYVAPPGDNLVELLKRIEAVVPGNPEVAQLREQAAAALYKKAREQLRRRHTLAALDSYQALVALQPEARFPRAELAVQLSAMARVMHRGRDKSVALARTAVELAPKLAVTHLALGDALLGQGQRTAAATEYRRVLGLPSPGSEHRQAMRGLAHTTSSSGSRAKRHAASRG